MKLGNEVREWRMESDIGDRGSKRPFFSWSSDRSIAFIPLNMFSLLFSRLNSDFTLFSPPWPPPQLIFAPSPHTLSPHHSKKWAKRPKATYYIVWYSVINTSAWDFQLKKISTSCLVVATGSLGPYQTSSGNGALSWLDSNPTKARRALFRFSQTLKTVNCSGFSLGLSVVCP